MRPAAPQGHGWPAERWCSSATDPDRQPRPPHRTSARRARPPRTGARRPSRPRRGTASDLRSHRSALLPDADESPRARPPRRANNPPDPAPQSHATGSARCRLHRGTMSRPPARRLDGFLRDADRQCADPATCRSARPATTAHRRTHRLRPRGTVRLRWRRRARARPTRCRRHHARARKDGVGGVDQGLPRTSRGESRSLGRSASRQSQAQLGQVPDRRMPRRVPAARVSSLRYRGSRQETGRCRAAVPAPRAHLCTAPPCPPIRPRERPPRRSRVSRHETHSDSLARALGARKSVTERSDGGPAYIRVTSNGCQLSQEQTHARGAIVQVRFKGPVLRAPWLLPIHDGAHPVAYAFVPDRIGHDAPSD